MYTWKNDDIVNFKFAMDNNFELESIYGEYKLEMYKILNIYVARCKDVFSNTMVFEVNSKDIQEFSQALTGEIYKLKGEI